MRRGVLSGELLISLLTICQSMIFLGVGIFLLFKTKRRTVINSYVLTDRMKLFYGRLFFVTPNTLEKILVFHRIFLRGLALLIAVYGCITLIAGVHLCLAIYLEK